MERDLHFFVGSLFASTGAVLFGYGLVSDPSIYQRSLGWNVNLWWGLVVTVFGVLFLALWKAR
jgi:hypothetical protein